MCFVALLVEEHLHYNIRYWRIENLLKGYSAYITLRSCWRAVSHVNRELVVPLQIVTKAKGLLPR